MQAFSDYLVSAIIGGIVLLIVLSLKFRGEQASIDATQYRAAKIGTLSIVAALERDFNNIGSAYLPTSHMKLNPDTALIVFDTLSNPARFAFWAQTDSTQAPRQVRYEWETSGRTVQLNSGLKPLYDVRRLVNGALDGQSSNMITGLAIHLLTKDSTGITNVRGIGSAGLPQLILVRLQAVSPLGAGEIVEETRWEKMFRPANLWKRRDI